MPRKPMITFIYYPPAKPGIFTEAGKVALFVLAFAVICGLVAIS